MLQGSEIEDWMESDKAMAARAAMQGTAPDKEAPAGPAERAHQGAGAPEVIAAEGLGLTFETRDGPVEALKGVDLAIAKGDFVSFIGPSGCGKTTFLRCVAALEHPTAGGLHVNGMSPDQARRARAYGYVFQAPRSCPGGPSARISACRWKSWECPRRSSRRVPSGC